MTSKEFNTVNNKLSTLIDTLNKLSNDTEYGSTLNEAINNAARSLERAQTLLDKEYN